MYKLINIKYKYLKVEVSVKHSWAVRTTKSFHSTMNLHMFVEVGSLCETKTAILIGARVRSLISVDSKVIKEIVPLPEVFATVIMITF
jgi:hypothetical protein